MKNQMQKAVDKVANWARECGITISPQKTNAMLFTNKQKIPDIDLTLKVDGQVIEYVEHAKCLGITFDTKLTWNKHIDNKIKQAKLYLHQMKTSIARTWGPTPEKMLWIWTTVVRPAITYGSYIWATKLTKAQKERLNKVQRLALMQLGNFRFTTPEQQYLLFFLPPTCAEV